jgi:predicted metal-dependent hydrolase
MSAVLERAEVRYGNTAVPYAVHRSARRGTVSIVVSPQQGVVLQAPTGTSQARLAEVVRLKAPWILRQMRRQRGLGHVVAKEFISGETFLYLGRQYRLRVLADADEVKLRSGWLRVPRHGARAQLVAWYKRHAEERLLERVAHWSRRLQQPVAQVLVREQAMRWGSCDASGNLRFNWRIIQAPMALIDYVVAHELVHVRHRNHDAGFWRALARVMPDCEQRRRDLKVMGPRLEW